MKYLNLLFLIFFCFSCNTENVSVVPKENTNNTSLTPIDSAVNSLFLKYQKEINTVGLSIGIYKNGVVNYYGYGETKLNSGKIPDKNTYFEIGSITKTYTSIACMNMLLENSETLESPIRPYLPSRIPVLTREGVEVNFKHLLTHTSGLSFMPDNRWILNTPESFYANYSRNDLFNWLMNAPLMSKPFTKFEYSNSGFGLLGTILELNYGYTYDRILKEKIFTPLNLNETKTEMGETNLNNWATGYEEGKESKYWTSLNSLNGAGVIKSTTTDMVKYGIYNINPPNSRLGQAIAATQNVTYVGENLDGCLGWFLTRPTEKTQNRYLWHNGGTGGFNSEIFINKSKNIVLILLYNNFTKDQAGRNRFSTELLNYISN